MRLNGGSVDLVGSHSQGLKTYDYETNTEIKEPHSQVRQAYN